MLRGLTLRAKILMPLAALSALLFAYLYGHWMPRSLANVEELYRKSIEQHIESVSEGLIPLLLSRQLDTIYENLNALEQQNGDWIDISLLDENGRPIYPLQSPQKKPDGRGIHTIERRIEYLGMPLGTLVVSVDFRPHLAGMEGRQRELVIAVLIVVLAFFIAAGFIIERVVLRPIHILSGASKSLSRGDFNVPLVKGGTDEVGTLVDSFIEMRGAICGYQTELLQRSEVLKKNEHLLAEAQRIAHIGSWELDLAKNQLSWSDEVYRIFGIEPGEFKASYEAFLEAVHPEDREYVAAAYSDCLREGVPYDIIHRIIRKIDGEVRHVHEKGEHIRDQAGQIVRSFGTAQDITDRKKAEEEIRQLASIVQSSDDAIIGKTLEGSIISWNRGAEEMYGYSAGEMRGRSVSVLVPPDHPDDAPAILERIRRGEHVERYETVRMKKGGERIFVSLTVSPIRDATGSVIGASAIARDITDRKRAEERLRLANAYNRSLIEASLDPLVTIGTDGRITDVNAATEAVTGLKRQELVGTDFSDYFTEPDNARAGYQRVFSDGFVRDYSLELRHRDGSITPVLYNASLYRDESGAVIGVFAAARDITERKKLEEQLRQSQKMEAVGTLAGGIAHDFNNILSAVIGYADLLSMKMSEDDPMREDVAQILAAADRAARLTRSLLAFSRKQVMNARQVSLNEIIRNVGNLLRRVIGEDIALKTVCSEEPLEICADSGQMEQVLLNLAVNARDAMPRGGKLVIETCLVELDESFINAHGYGRPGHYALLLVSDSGTGMDEDTSKRIFEPFFTTKEQGKGSGLGLAIAYGIVKQHEGYINAYSEIGKGTTFKIYLPLVAKAKAAGQEAAARPPRPAGGTETILIAEDDAALRKLNESVLSGSGYTVITAEDGEEAILKFLENRGSVNLVLLDMIMPKKSGREAFDEIRKIRPDVKVLFASGYAADKVRGEMIVGNGCEFIMKPVAPRDLLKKVRDLLDR